MLDLLAITGRVATARLAILVLILTPMDLVALALDLVVQGDVKGQDHAGGTIVVPVVPVGGVRRVHLEGQREHQHGEQPDTGDTDPHILLFEY
jgi:hypothetical protein